MVLVGRQSFLFFVAFLLKVDLGCFCFGGCLAGLGPGELSLRFALVNERCYLFW
jgi:hypothetical protein